MPFVPDSTHSERQQNASLVCSLVREHAEELHRFLRRRARTPDSADDAFQTVFERLCKVRRMDLVRKPAEYLFSVAINVMRELRLRDERDARYLTFDTDVAQFAAGQVEHAVDDGSEALNLRRQLEAALASLPQIQRCVVLALKSDGMTYEKRAVRLAFQRRWSKSISSRRKAG